MKIKTVENQVGWRENFKAFLKPSVLRMLFLGFSSGLPILLIFSSLSLWLREAGIERSSVTFLSWAALGYSFKFIWAPLVDCLPVPFLTKMLGKRRSWMLVSQVSVVIAIVWMAMIDPSISSSYFTLMAMAAVLLGFSSATQDVVIDAFRIESEASHMQALLSSAYIAGYRVGMIFAGAGALFLASYLGSTKEHYNYGAWKWTYFIMALGMVVGMVTILSAKEPEKPQNDLKEYPTLDYLRLFGLFVIAVANLVAVFFLSKEWASEVKDFLYPFAGESLANFLVESGRLFISIAAAVVMGWGIVKLKLVRQKMVVATYVSPIKDFFDRYGTSAALLLLSLVGLYRISDIVLGVISNVFYQDLGFSKNQIASVVKTFGLVMTIVGGFLGGILSVRFGVMPILFLGAVLSAGTNLLFMLLAQMGDSLPMLYLVISADNLSAGLASAAFVAFLSSLTNISFTAVQFAIFTSLMTLLPKLLGGYSGTMVDALGYSGFFIVTTLMGLPVLFLVMLANRKLK